jgi:DNA-binding HxlR family transcriptional regulator
MISGKWKGLALYHLMEGPVRFSELKRRLGGLGQIT